MAELDFEHIADELEELMGNTRRELYRRLRVLLAHLLKWGLAGRNSFYRLGRDHPYTTVRLEPFAEAKSQPQAVYS